MRRAPQGLVLIGQLSRSSLADAVTPPGKTSLSGLLRNATVRGHLSSVPLFPLGLIGFGRNEKSGLLTKTLGALFHGEAVAWHFWSPSLNFYLFVCWFPFMLAGRERERHRDISIGCFVHTP